SRRNRRGGVAIEFEIGLFMGHILTANGPTAFGLSSKMSRRRVFGVPKSRSWRHNSRCWIRGAVRAIASDTELLADQSRDLAAVGTTLGFAHHVAHDRPDRLGVAGLHALDRVGIGCQRGGHDGREIVSSIERGKALDLDYRCRVSPL